MERAGIETIAFCETDHYCRKVLAKHWPDVPIHEDIRGLDGREYRGSVELVCGGFPCQPFSVAGKRAGANDNRSLWPEMFRVIREIQPAWAVSENVPGIISMELDTVLSDLEGIGYATQAIVIPACAVDAYHRRERVWIVAYANGEGEPDGAGHGAASGDMGYAIIDGLEGHAGDVENGDKSGRIGTAAGGSTGAAGVCGGRPAIWEPEPGVGRVANGVSNRMDRLRALGNAVVPQVVEAIGRMILDHYGAD